MITNSQYSEHGRNLCTFRAQDLCWVAQETCRALVELCFHSIAPASAIAPGSRPPTPAVIIAAAAPFEEVVVYVHLSAQVERLRFPFQKADRTYRSSSTCR